MDIPEISLVPAPYYRYVLSDTHETEKFNLDLMTEHTKTFAKFIEKIEETDSKSFGRSEFYSIIKANSVSGSYGFSLKGLYDMISDKLRK